ncbi:hypothetical protein BIW11_10012, partial [Tropilaelaps mercedesae]
MSNFFSTIKEHALTIEDDAVRMDRDIKVTLIGAHKGTLDV